MKREQVLQISLAMCPRWRVRDRARYTYHVLFILPSNDRCVIVHLEYGLDFDWTPEPRAPRTPTHTTPFHGDEEEKESGKMVAKSHALRACMHKKPDADSTRNCTGSCSNKLSASSHHASTKPSRIHDHTTICIMPPLPQLI
jgi:hypothetical protein